MTLMTVATVDGDDDGDDDEAGSLVAIQEKCSFIRFFFCSFADVVQFPSRVEVLLGYTIFTADKDDGEREEEMMEVLILFVSVRWLEMGFGCS